MWIADKDVAPGLRRSPRNCQADDPGSDHDQIAAVSF
jgi:hypothetical protein